MTIVEEIIVLRNGTNKLFQVFLTLAILAGVLAGVGAFAGEWVRGSNPYLIAATGVFAVIAIGIRVGGRVPVRLTRGDDRRYSLSISDRRASREFPLPLDCYVCMWWTFTAVGRKMVRVPRLLLAILDSSGSPQVVLAETLGVLHTPPEWPEGYVEAPTLYELSMSTEAQLEKFRNALVAAGATSRMPAGAR